MPAINFKTKWEDGSPTNFRDMILDGRKPHTIRPVRQHPVKKGDALSLYTGMRTSHCEIIGKVKCLDVRPIQIYQSWDVNRQLILNGKPLSEEHTQLLTINDGFENLEKFYDFFEYMYDQYQQEFDLRLIQWRETPY